MNNVKKRAKTKKTESSLYRGRYRLMQTLFVVAMALVSGRIAYLQVAQRPFLQSEGDKRAVREETVPAHRGVIFDRHGSPLAVSTQVVSLWADPQILLDHQERIDELGRALKMTPDTLFSSLKQAAGRNFFYLKRHMQPTAASKVLAMNIPGLNEAHEYRRYYPAGETAAQLVGLTNIDDHGQEGMELALDRQLAGAPGRVRFVKDRQGRVISRGNVLKSAEPGSAVYLSIDLRLQYLAYKALLKAVRKHKARSGSLVMLDPASGEVLAMVNQPSFNPNKRSQLNRSGIRNRAATDQFEPGSVVKPFIIAAALQSHRYTLDSIIDTNPGVLRVGRDTVRDGRNYGLLNLAGILIKSSNVGVTKLAMDIGPETIVRLFHSVGFGQPTGTLFPGESGGFIPVRRKWRAIETATLSFGYGLSVSALQLAKGYAILANGGHDVQVTLLKSDRPDALAATHQVISTEVSEKVLAMMAGVTGPRGTARRAAIAGYTVAGKTGTVKKIGANGYSANNHVALFVGAVPAQQPRLVMVVVIDDPQAGEYYGGAVAAPVFAQVARQAMHILGVPEQQNTAPPPIATGPGSQTGGTKR